MSTCPICAKSLETVRQREGVYYLCRACDGRAVTIPQVRHVLGDRVATKLLRLMKLTRRQGGRSCPFCGAVMPVVTCQDPLLELDACRTCNLVWFDRPSYDSLPELNMESTSTRPMQATEIIALERLKELKEREEAERKKARRRRFRYRDTDPN